MTCYSFMQCGRNWSVSEVRREEKLQMPGDLSSFGEKRKKWARQISLKVFTRMPSTELQFETLKKGLGKKRPWDIVEESLL